MWNRTGRFARSCAKFLAKLKMAARPAAHGEPRPSLQIAAEGGEAPWLPAPGRAKAPPKRLESRVLEEIWRWKLYGPYGPGGPCWKRCGRKYRSADLRAELISGESTFLDARGAGLRGGERMAGCSSALAHTSFFVLTPLWLCD